MKLAVTGGRDFRDWKLVEQVLGTMHLLSGIEVLIHGDAPGADALCGKWATNAAPVQVRVFPADWTLGRKAGPIRNRRMLTEARPDFLLAFPGGRGTQHCISVAHELGIPVLEATDLLSRLDLVLAGHGLSRTDEQ